MLQFHPIGTFYSKQIEKYMAPRQAALGIESNGCIILNPNHDYEQALEDLIGFDHIWLIYVFDRNKNWKPKVLTPRGGPKRGVFATRSPHRPNPIGLSCVELLGIEGRMLFIGKSDLLNDTPILDIKPYISYADAFPDSKQGWIGNLPQPKKYSLKWSEELLIQAKFIEEKTNIHFLNAIELRLSDNPFPFPNHRIKQVNDNHYELSFKTWRIIYTVDGTTIIINRIKSGYDQETLGGRKTSSWNDVPLHLEFLGRFNT